jgi:thiamine-phosphate pyrophosphorylase
MISNWGLYLVTDNRVYPGRSHIDEVKAVIAGGARVVQFREKQMNDRDLLATGTVLRKLTTDSNVDFIVNNRVDIALALDADGVHVGQEDMPVINARRLMGPHKILGVSASTVEEAIKAESESADYIGASPVFATSTKPDAPHPTGLEGLRAMAEAINIPIVAIGGINLENVEQVISAGADSAAVISAVVCAPDMVKATEKLVATINAAKSHTQRS